jgi:X-X-X-Leu-X-X-Gly heptad repeat protein
MSRQKQIIGFIAISLAMFMGTLQSGFYRLISTLGGLQDGSSQLVSASGELKSGASDLAIGVGKAGRADEIQKFYDGIKSDKDDETAGAFDQIFLIAAVVLTVLSVFGLFTDRKENK